MKSMASEKLFRTIEGVDFEQRETDIRLSHKKWNQLPQVTDNYVVHARGFSLGNKIWFDAYNLHSEHTHLWNDCVSQETEYDQYDGDWPTFLERTNFDEPWLYWSISSPGQLLIQHPQLEDISDDQFQQIADLVNALNIPKDAIITFSRDTEAHSMYAELIYEKFD